MEEKTLLEIEKIRLQFQANISLDLVRLNVPLKLNVPIKIHYETESP